MNETIFVTILFLVFATIAAVRSVFVPKIFKFSGIASDDEVMSAFRITAFICVIAVGAIAVSFFIFTILKKIGG